MAVTGHSGVPGWTATTCSASQWRAQCQAVTWKRKGTRWVGKPFPQRNQKSIPEDSTFTDASTTCPHQQGPAEEMALFMRLDSDRLGSNPSLLSGHSLLGVVKVALVLIPEPRRSLGKLRITVPIRGPCHLRRCHSEDSYSCQDPMLAWPSISLLFIRSNIKCLIISLLCFCP
jgi:hypothetical protein